jgi:F-type H+-transporting ATPase subunit delta
MENPALVPLLTSLPGRYAHGLFMALGNAERLKALSILGDLAHYFEQHPAHSALLQGTYRLHHKEADYKAVLTGLSNGLVHVENFLHTLFENKRFNLLSDISAIFKRLVYMENNIKQVVIKTPSALDKQSQTDVKDVFATMLSSKIEATFQEEPALLGGIQAEVDNTRIELSLQNHIDHLGQLLKGEL